MHGLILLNYSKEFIYLIIYRNNKYRQLITLISLLLPVIVTFPGTTLNVSFTVPSYAILVHVDDEDAKQQGLIDYPEEKNRRTIIFRG